MSKKTEFQTWREETELNVTEAAEALGLSRSHAMNLDAGRNRAGDDVNKPGRRIELTRIQRLAMAAVAKRLKPWGDK